MNPLDWRPEHQVALLLGVVIGIVIGLAGGFMYDGIHGALAPTVGDASFHDKTAAGIMLWLGTGSALRWGVFGAFVGGAIIYTRQLLHV